MEGTGKVEGAGVERIPLTFTQGFSWRAVVAVMAEKFGLRGLRIAGMIGFMIGYFWYRRCDSWFCVGLYILAAGFIVMMILVVWTAKESLDKFVAQHQGEAYLVVDEKGVGGQSKGETFHMPWQDFKRIRERGAFWLLETRHGAWMVIPTSNFTAAMWERFRARATTPARSAKA